MCDLIFNRKHNKNFVHFKTVPTTSVEAFHSELGYLSLGPAGALLEIFKGKKRK